MQDPLFVKQFTPSVSKQPLNTHFQEYVADSASSSGISWNIDSPFAGALLDNEVYVEYEVKFNADSAGATTADDDFREMYEGGDEPAANTGEFISLPANSYKLALRQGFAIHGGLQNCEVVMNGQSLRQTPNRYMAEFARFYAHPSEIEGVASMSGGCLDSGTFTSLTRDHASAPVVNSLLAGAALYQAQSRLQDLHGVYPALTVVGVAGSRLNRSVLPTTDDRWYNEGFTKRCHRLQDQWRESAPANTASAILAQGRYPLGFALKVYERLPISPFMMWEAKDKKRSIPYVDKMEINLTFYSDAIKLMFQSSLPASNLANINWYTTAPKLHLKWYIPPPGSLMPPEISIPVSQYKESVQTVTIANPAALNQGVPSDSAINYSNLRLQQIPDLLMIYVKPSAANFQAVYASEHHLEITQCDITVNGDTGKVLRANSAQLFAMYARNSPMRNHKKLEYNQWRKRFCTVALRPSDMGVRVPPGVNHGVTLDVRLNVKSWWAVPAVGSRFSSTAGTVIASADNDVHPGGFDSSTDWEIHVLGIYDKYELTLTNRGNAQLKLQNVPSLDMPQSLASVDRSDLRAQFA